MPGPDRQFDPIANSALGAIRASNRGLNQFQSSLGAPTLPSQPNVQRGFRNGIKTLSHLSPLNIIASGGPPSPDQFVNDVNTTLPSSVNLPVPGENGSGSSGLPSPQQFLPNIGNRSNGVDLPDFMPTPGNGNGAGGNGGGNGGNGNGSTPDAEPSSRGRGVSR